VARAAPTSSCPERVEPALAPIGIQAAEVLIGDVLDAVSVQRALDGCDAVIHAAVLYSMDPRAGVAPWQQIGVQPKSFWQRQRGHDSIPGCTCPATWPCSRATMCSVRTVRSVWVGHLTHTQYGGQ
jgi:hypothetical protein